MFIITNDETTLVNLDNIISLEISSTNPLTNIPKHCIVATSERCIVTLAEFTDEADCADVFYRLLGKIKEGKSCIEMRYI